MPNRTIFAATLLILSAAPMAFVAHGQDAPANASQQATPGSREPASATSNQKDQKDKQDRKDKKPTAASSNSDSASSGGRQAAVPPDAPAVPSTSAPIPGADAQTNSPSSAALPKRSTASDNPFPEDVSKQAAADAKAAATTMAAPNAPVRQEGGSSSLDGLDKLGTDDGARKQLKLESPDGSTGIYDPKRADEDIRVGRFYLKTGDPKGAYQRFKDATDYDHENAEAVYWLAEAARKLNLAQEATQNYMVYLAAVPDGQNAKAAKKALNELASTAKR